MVPSDLGNSRNCRKDGGRHEIRGRSYTAGLGASSVEISDVSVFMILPLRKENPLSSDHEVGLRFFSHWHRRETANAD